MKLGSIFLGTVLFGVCSLSYRFGITPIEERDLDFWMLYSFLGFFLLLFLWGAVFSFWYAGHGHLGTSDHLFSWSIEKIAEIPIDGGFVQLFECGPANEIRCIFFVPEANVDYGRKLWAKET